MRVVRRFLRNLKASLMFSEDGIEFPYISKQLRDKMRKLFELMETENKEPMILVPWIMAIEDFEIMEFM